MFDQKECKEKIERRKRKTGEKERDYWMVDDRRIEREKERMGERDEGMN